MPQTVYVRPGTTLTVGENTTLGLASNAVLWIEAGARMEALPGSIFNMGAPSCINGYGTSWT